MFTNQRKRNLIRTLYDLSLENHIPFQQQLQQSRKEASEAGISGIIQQQSGNGISTVFVGMSVADAEEAIGSVEDLYDTAVDDLAGRTPAIDSPTDEQIRDTMLALVPKGRLHTVYPDYSCLQR